MIRITEKIFLDPDEIEESYERASGPGGQNVNKVSTAVRLRLDVANSPSLPEYVKKQIYTVEGAYLSKSGVLSFFVQEHRSQQRNREIAQARLVSVLQKAAFRPKKRLATRPTLASKRRRIEAKSRRSMVKSTRGRPKWD